MAFREEQHARKGGKFAPKGSGGSAATGASAAGAKKPPGKDSHSDRVPEAIRKDEVARLDKLLGENPTPQEAKRVLKGEADKLTSRAKSLMGALRASRKAEEASAHRRGEKGHQEAKRKRDQENAERARKGLPPLKEPKKRKPDTSGGSGKSGGGAGKGGGGKSGGGGGSSDSGGPDRNTKEKLQVVYQRLTVVRDEAFSRGVKL